ncbi:peptide deformylase [Candidatus Saccharibacteria bacterium]|nr:peptide deformylase [Candidatus Saccharibacteria bacterium]MCB9821291.1 peptide deformylase [Candidatus Nomurabacteria bacterium]
MSVQPKSKIITLPNSSLRQASRKVGLINEQIIELIQTMTDQANAWDISREHEVTVGLAAVQIDELWKVVIIREDFDDHNNQNYIALINPEIVKYEGEIVENFEGCLSVKDYYAKVPRYSKVRVKATTVEGQEVRFNADGFLARVVQHEVDHTKGITIVDRVEDLKNGFRIINDKGEMEPVVLEQVKQSGILQDE